MAKRNDLHEIDKIISLAQQNIYNQSEKSIDVELGINIVTEICSMAKVTPEALEYVRESDGWSLLHFAIASYNPFLVALFRYYGFDVDARAEENSITPRELFTKIGHLVDEMKEAFKQPISFLAQFGIVCVEQIESEYSFDGGANAQQSSSSSLIGEELTGYDEEIGGVIEE